MQRYESIETLAVKLNQPKLFNMSSKGITAQDIIEMKYNEAEAFGFTQDEYMKLKTYLKNHQLSPTTTQPSPQKIAPEIVAIQVVQQNGENVNGDCFGPCCLGCMLSSLFSPST